MGVSGLAVKSSPPVSAEALMAALPHPALAIRDGGSIAYVNPAAEQFFDMSTALLQRQPLQAVFPFGSPVLTLVEQARVNAQTVSEYGVKLGSPRIGARVIDAHVSALTDGSGLVLLLLQERSIAEKMDRAMVSQHAARSVSAMAAVLAHEIKNPLAGIRGAAQLIEQNAGEDDRALTRLIVTETDRIRGLVDRMEVFSDMRPVKREPVNIHEVLDHVRKLAETSFARGVRIIAAYDPSLPPVMGERDRLVQVILNLVKNAADAVEGRPDAEIQLHSAYRPGVHLSLGPARGRISLPLELTIRDNGSGIAPDVLPTIFEPFVTTKAKGTGLGLALAAKIIGDHGGVIECESEPRKTLFRIRLPIGRGPAPPLGA
jgi:two-component system nitrogen regulation sensor histidine kinase GlnL